MQPWRAFPFAIRKDTVWGPSLVSCSVGLGSLRIHYSFIKRSRWSRMKSVVSRMKLAADRWPGIFNRRKPPQLRSFWPLTGASACGAGLRVADGLGQHLAQLSLRLWRFPREARFLPVSHRSYVGMLEGEVNAAGDY